MKMRNSWRLGAFALATTLTGLAAARDAHDANRYAYLSPTAVADSAPAMARGPMEIDPRCVLHDSEHTTFVAGDTDALATRPVANNAVLDSGGSATQALPIGINVSASNAGGGLCCAVATSQLVMVNVTSNAFQTGALQNASNTFGINVSSNTGSLRAINAAPVVSSPTQ